MQQVYIIPIVEANSGFDFLGFNIALKEAAEVSHLATLIKAGSMMSEDILLDNLLRDRLWEGGIPLWANEPEAVYFIGSLADLKGQADFSEQEVNHLLQMRLHSTAYKSAKLAMLENIREKILAEREY